MSSAPDSPPTPPAAPVLTARERSALKARAHALEPVVRIGQAGLTEAAVAAIDHALTAHELIKVKIGEGEREERAAISTAMAARTGAAVVQGVGRIVVLWRPRPDEAPTR